MTDFDNSLLIQHIDRAIEELLAARMKLGGLADVAVPDEALNVALRDSPDVQDARRQFLSALAAIDVAGDAVARQVYLQIEEAANAVASECAAAGWRLGLLATKGWGDSQGE